MFKKKICFVSKDVYSLLTKKTTLPYGGSEVKIFNIANELKNYNYKIYFICKAPEHIREILNINGFTVIPWITPKVRNKYWRVLKEYFHLFSIMKRINAYVYISQNANIIIFITGLFCRLHKKKFVHWVSHYFDTLKENKKGMKQRDFLLYKFGTKLSNLTIAQTEDQKTSLMRNRNIRSYVVRTGHPILKSKDINHREKKYVLWVGRLKKSKQPHLFIDLAEKFKDKSFAILGEFHKSDKPYFTNISRRINEVNNVVHLESVPYKDVSKFYEKSLILVNTSVSEGFPNTFIEAWNHGIPVVSLNFDPDNVIKKYQLGYHSGTFEKMVNDVKNLTTNETKRIKFGKNAIAYVQKFHDIKDTTKKFHELLMTIT